MATYRLTGPDGSQNDLQAAKTDGAKRVVSQQLQQLMGRRWQMMQDAQRDHETADLQRLADAARERGDIDAHGAYTAAIAERQGGLSRKYSEGQSCQC
jgi:hypothetical protein